MTTNDLETKKIIDDLPTAVIRWYPFKQRGTVLFLGDNGAVVDVLRNVFKMDVTVSGIERVGEISAQFDYVVCIGGLELCVAPNEILSKLHQVLGNDGILLLGMNNRLGLRYFCGDHDIYTNRSFDGVESYSHNHSGQGRMYSRGEIEAMLSETGWERRKFYSVLPNLDEPVFVYADGQLPKEDLANRLFPSYNYPQTVFLEEETLYKSLAENGMFHLMANAYLIECSTSGKFADALYVTSSLERGRENAMLTVVHENGTVSKEAAYPEGRERLKKLDENMKSLQKNGVPIVEGHLDSEGRYVMPYIESVTAQVYLKDLLLTDKDSFLEAMDAFRDTILSSSSTHNGEFTDSNEVRGTAELFDTAFLDLVPLNSFYLDGKYVFFDQEFTEKNYPVNVVLNRMLTTFYAGNPELKQILPVDYLYERYGLLQNKKTWLEMDWAFLRKLRQEEPLAEYHSRVRRNNIILKENRMRLNCLARDYRKLFFDIFQDADTKKLILFGSGNYAREFMNLYRVRYPVYAILDNNENAWGQEIHGVAVQSPELLKNLQRGEYKVLICIKNFLPVMDQLEMMGVEDYSVFDPGKSFASPKNPTFEVVEKPHKESRKKYHVGYVAGVFDLFHYGHLNILRRAKEHCDYLIVGVVSDRQVCEKKKVEPFVPFEERLEIVRSCRYVDEAHEIPFEHPDTDMAWKLYHFDVQFSGSDYEHDDRWLKKQAFLRERGADLVFFPYTEQTSSTKIKALIKEKLL